MPAIHHATQKKANQSGIGLEIVDGKVQAIWAERNKRTSHIDAKIALANMVTLKMLTLEYPMLVVTEATTGEWGITLEDDNIGSGSTLDEAWEAAQEYVQDNEIELDDYDAAEENEADEDEESEGGSVVPTKYKLRYAEIGRDGVGSGDWLDNLLANLTTEKNEKGRATLNMDALVAIANANGVTVSGKNNGLIRMTTRNKLETVIAAKTGKDRGLIVPEGFGGNTFYKAPADWTPRRGRKERTKKAK